MKNFKTIGIILFVIAILVIVKMVFLKPKDGGKAPGPAAGAKAAPTMVTVYVAVPEDVSNKVFASGTVLANEEVELMPEISGKILALKFNEGTTVSKGDLLVKINDADFQAQVKKLELQVKLAEEKENRGKQLLAINGLSQEEYDVLLNQLNSAKADIDYLKAQIAKTEIRAPFNGVIGLKAVSEGSFISPNVRIASILQIDPVKIDFSIPEQYAGLIKKNDALQFSIEGLSKPFSAKIYAIEPRVDLNTRSIQIRAICPNPDHAIFPGAFAKVDLPLKEIPDAIMIPTEAIVPVLKGKKVFVCKDGKAVSVPVETGIRTAARVQVVKGLQVGDSVITTGVMQLKPDSPVKALKSKK
jgi:membrane fusion protein (multidrug efflux system)